MIFSQGRRKALTGFALLTSTFSLMTAHQASAVDFPTLSNADVDPALQTLAASTLFRSLEGPSHPLLFGIFLNVRASSTTSSGLTTLMKSAGSGTDIAGIPFAHIQAGVNLPFGLGIEAGYLPSVSASGLSLGSFGAGAKMSISKFIPFLPLDVAVRASYTSSNFGITGTVTESGVPVTASVDYKSTVMGGTLDIGKSLLGIVEPYAGIGLMNQSSTLGVTGSAAILANVTAAASNAVTSNTTSLYWKVGLQFSLGVNIGAQMDSAFGATTYSVKTGFRI